MYPRLILQVNEVYKIRDQQVRRSAQRDKSRAFVRVQRKSFLLLAIRAS